MDVIGNFRDLLAQSAPVFLIGAGCSRCAGLPLTAELTDRVLDSKVLNAEGEEILLALKDLFTGAAGTHIEDYLSELIDLLAIAERRAERGASRKRVLLGSKEYDAEQLRGAADQIKRAVAAVIDRKVSIDTHRAFVAAVHRPVRVGKAGPSHADYLVLNYDTAIEDALALERVPFTDGIDGGVTGWWNPQVFRVEGLAARVYKLHGSINWFEIPGDLLPRRIGPRLQLHDLDDRRILIWPASTKYREAQLDPYAQLLELARRAVRPGHAMQRVLVICGYGFGDRHINIEIEEALRESAGNLTVVAFTSEDQPVGQLKAWLDDKNVQDQVLAFANRGFFHGASSLISERDLLWWKFENVTRLLGGGL